MCSKTVFRAQIRLAKEAGLPIALHMREAHDDGFAILEEEGFPEAGTLLHCFNLDAAEVARSGGGRLLHRLRGAAHLQEG